MFLEIEDNSYFVNNFIKIMTSKFINIYYNINDPHMSKNIENEEKTENKEDLENEENKYIPLQEKKENKDNQENSQQKKEEKKENEENIEGQEKLLVLFFIEDRLKTLEKKLNDNSEIIFKQVFKKIFQDYLNELQRLQSSKNKEFKVNAQIIDINEVEKNFEAELLIFFKNEFFKYFFCIILKLMMNNLKNILNTIYQKELKENESISKIINQKAEDSLKTITEKLKEDLIIELDKNVKVQDNKNDTLELDKNVKVQDNKNDTFDFDFNS